ncbi:dCTP deaminase [bacterium]|nr:dCTP deaminase [bacterium]NBX72094.1 dCTP deaminase [bacterium]
MRLSDKDIKKAIQQGLISITPYEDLERIQGVAVDLHLGHEFRVFSGHKIGYVDLAAPADILKKMLDDVMQPAIQLDPHERFMLHPGELVLAVTHESISIPNTLVGWLDGRSSLARLGLMVHVTSHRIDPGWQGQIVLECFNSGKLPLALAPMMKICAINFEQLTSAVEHSYLDRRDAKYKNQQGAVASKINHDQQY